MKRISIYCFLAAALLFLTTFYFVGIIYDLFFSFFEHDPIQFLVTDLGGGFLESIRISIAIAIIPLSALLVWKAGRVTRPGDRVLSVLVILFFIMVSNAVNVFRIKSLARLTPTPVAISYPFDKVYIEYFILGGIIIGAFLSYFLYKEKSNPLPPVA